MVTDPRFKEQFMFKSDIETTNIKFRFFGFLSHFFLKFMDRSHWNGEGHEELGIKFARAFKEMLLSLEPEVQAEILGKNSMNLKHIETLQMRLSSKNEGECLYSLYIPFLQSKGKVVVDHP